MTPNYECFLALGSICNRLMDTYDYLPDAHTKYPFCFVEYGRIDEQTNNDAFGEYTVYVHFFGKRTDRKVIDIAMSQLHDDLRKPLSTKHYAMSVKTWRNFELPESNDAPGILHFIADITLNYNKK